MYNGIGLTTVRGSGTNGYVQTNRAFVRASNVRQATSINNGAASRLDDLPRQRQANEEILEHQRKRKVEVKVLELREAMEERGYSEREIEEKCSEVRAQLSSASASAAAGKGSHAAVKQKDAEMARMKQAFGIGGDFVEGASFDRELQEQRRQERISAREEKSASSGSMRADARRRRGGGCASRRRALLNARRTGRELETSRACMSRTKTAPRAARMTTATTAAKMTAATRVARMKIGARAAKMTTRLAPPRRRPRRAPPRRRPRRAPPRRPTATRAAATAPRARRRGRRPRRAAATTTATRAAATTTAARAATTTTATRRRDDDRDARRRDDDRDARRRDQRDDDRDEHRRDERLVNAVGARQSRARTNGGVRPKTSPAHAPAATTSALGSGGALPQAAHRQGHRRLDRAVLQTASTQARGICRAM